MSRDPSQTPLGRELARLNAASDAPELNAFPAVARFRIADLALWSTQLSGLKFAIPPPTCGRGNPIVVGDAVFFASFSPGILFALDRHTGASRWTLALDYYGHSPAAGPGGLILAPTAKSLRAVRIETGEIVWTFGPKKRAGEQMYSSPTAVDDKIYIGDRAGFLYALDAGSGAVVWRVYPSRADNNQINSTPAVGSGVVAVGTNAKLALGFDAGTGREVWRQRLDGPCTNAIPTGGELLVWTWRTAYRFRVADGTPLGRWHRRHHHIRSAAAAGDVTLLVYNREWPVEPHTWPVCELIAYRGDGELYRFNYPLHGGADLRYEAATGVVYESTYRGIGVLDPATGSRRAAVVGDGEFYGWLASSVMASDGAMYVALDRESVGDSDGPPRVVALRHP